tara:strand:+ start:974 stop:1549 length:576 start_codon:yes stop_codon:yes gene_type:complete
MDLLLEKIRKSINLSAKASDYIQAIAKRMRIAKGVRLIEEGQMVRKSYFVLDGCLRSYCYSSDGKEHTLQFAIKDWWISDFIAFYRNDKAVLNVECLIDSEILEFDSKDLERLFVLFPEFQKFHKENLENHIISLNKRILNQLQLSASDRYELFINQYPDIHQYVPNYLIASYLGITQQSLSRIKIETSRK